MEMGGGIWLLKAARLDWTRLGRLTKNVCVLVDFHVGSVSVSAVGMEYEYGW
jgi:hypothetical protein